MSTLYYVKEYLGSTSFAIIFRSFVWSDMYVQACNCWISDYHSKVLDMADLLQVLCTWHDRQNIFMQQTLHVAIMITRMVVLLLLILQLPNNIHYIRIQSR